MITNFIAIDANPALVEFRDYVMSFYAHDAPRTLYPIEGCTEAVVEIAIQEYIKIVCNPDRHEEWGDGDSLDRERVRDLIYQVLPIVQTTNDYWKDPRVINQGHLYV